MLLHGDEFGRGQQGNNNTYCQDSPLAWMDWSLAEANAGLLEFTRRAAALRARHPVFRRRRFFDRPLDGRAEIAWFAPDGRPMGGGDWTNGFSKALAVHLDGQAIPDPDATGGQVVDDSFLLLFNAYWEPIDFSVPAELSRPWSVVLDTAASGEPDSIGQEAASTVRALERSLVVLQSAAARPALRGETR